VGHGGHHYLLDQSFGPEAIHSHLVGILEVRIAETWFQVCAGG